MKEAYSYLGHSIDLDLTRSHELFRCTYFIDRCYCFESSASSPDVETARTEALSAAHRSIAMLDA